jgi:hypothetical protein
VSVRFVLLAVVGVPSCSSSAGLVPDLEDQLALVGDSQDFPGEDRFVLAGRSPHLEEQTCNRFVDSSLVLGPAEEAGILARQECDIAVVAVAVVAAAAVAAEHNLSL